jgi:tetratricopeptide (TPR) repeat protein
MRRVVGIWAALLILSLTAGCSLTGKEAAVTPPVEQKVETVPGEIDAEKLAARIKEKNFQRDLILVREHIQEGNYPEALALIGKVIEEGQPESRFEQELPDALNALIESANFLLRSGEFQQSGLLTREVLLNYPTTQQLVDRLNKGRETLEADLEQCAEGMMAKGVARYRAGELREAMAIWKQLLLFYPDHAAARQALNTTELQLKTLEKL